MNNIYKVIWSKAKNCYVVASEIAKSHTKSASGSEKMGGYGKKALLALVAASAIFCGGLVNVGATVHVNEGTGATSEVYTTGETYNKTEVDLALAAKGAANDVASNRTDIDNLKTAVGGLGSGLTKDVADQKADIATNRANINNLDGKLADLTTTVSGKADEAAVTTALDSKADTDLSNLTAAGETKIKDTMSADMANKADVTTVTTLEGRVNGVEGKVTALETKVGDASSGLVKDVATLKTTVGDASSGLVKDVNDLNTAIGTKANQNDLVAATNRITANEGNITELQRKTTNIDYDVANQTTSINGMKVGQQVDMGGKDITNARALTATGKVTGDGVDAGTGAITGGSLTVTGKVTGNGVDAGAGDITTTGNVKGGTLEATGYAKIGGDLTVNGKLNVDEISMKNDRLDPNGDQHHSATTITADGISNNAKVTDKNGVTTESKFTHDKEGSTTYAKKGDDADWKEATSNVTADGVENIAKDSKGNNNTFTQTSTDTKNTLTDKEGNTSSTRQDSKGIYGYAKDKDGNKSYTKQEGNRIAESVIGQDGKETKSEMTSTGITNTAKDGTITSDAKDIVNKATGNISNSSATMDTTVTGKATESYGELETEVKGNEKHTVKGDQTNEVDGKQINTIKNGQENIISGGQTNTITGRQINNITGDQTTNVSGTQTTTATDINRNASGGMIDTIDNDYGTNTETKVAGRTTTDVSIKGTGERGQYIRGANESRDYLIKGTLKNSETKTAEATSTEITDGTNKASTIQDAKNLAGSVTNGTETGVSGIHANNDGSVSIDSSVAGGGMSSVINQKKDSIQSAVGDVTNSTVIHQDKDNVTIASSNGMVRLVGKDIVNNAQNTITNTAGTKITDTAGDSTVTTENGKGTTFTKTGSTAYREGGPTDTNISGNTITTGKVTMDYADVIKDLGVRGNANITGKTTTGSLEVTGTSTLTGDVTMESNAKVKKDLTVEGTTTTKTLKVTENAEIDGTLKVAKKATFEDSVSIAKDLSVGGDVTAKSYKVGDKTYISAAGINANDQKITNVADGSISEGSKDAVNGGQLYGVKNDLEGKVNKVGANAAAMANLHPMEFDPDSKWNIAAAIGNYGSETAAALGAFYRPNDDVMVNLSTAFGTGENMVGGGVSVRLGQGGNKLSREDSNQLKAQVADLTARMDALLSVLNPNMSKDFPDVPENHWAYEAVSRLAGNDIVQGYPDGEFHGERTMTRYEMAEIIYNALSRGAEAEKELVEEFKPELQAMAASEKATAERAEG